MASTLFDGREGASLINGLLLLTIKDLGRSLIIKSYDEVSDKLGP